MASFKNLNIISNTGFLTFIFLHFILTCGCNNEDVCSQFFTEDKLAINAGHEELFKEHKIDEALELVNKVLQQDSTNYVAWNDRAVYQFEICKKMNCGQQKYLKILDDLQRSINTCPDFAKPYSNKIHVLYEIEQYDDILKTLAFYQKSFGDNSKLLSLGGDAHFELGKIDSALILLNKAIELDSADAKTYIFRGRCFFKKKSWDKAMEDFNKGLMLDSISLGFHERANLYSAQGSVEKAITDFFTALELFPDRYESYVGLGSIEIARNNHRLACFYYEKALEIVPDHPEVKALVFKYCRGVKI